MIIQIDRKKVFNLLFVNDFKKTFFNLLAALVVYVALKYFFEVETTILSRIMTIILFVVTIRFVWLVIESYMNSKTLVYEFEEDKHTATYSFITKHRTQARTQVVNNITIYQDLIDKFFGMFNLEVSYGFNGDGYSFTYNFLTEEQALELESKIKSTTGKTVSIK